MRRECRAALPPRAIPENAPRPRIVNAAHLADGEHDRLLRRVHEPQDLAALVGNDGGEQAVGAVRADALGERGAQAQQAALDLGAALAALRVHARGKGHVHLLLGELAHAAGRDGAARPRHEHEARAAARHAAQLLERGGGHGGAVAGQQEGRHARALAQDVERGAQRHGQRRRAVCRQARAHDARHDAVRGQRGHGVRRRAHGLGGAHVAVKKDKLRARVEPLRRALGLARGKGPRAHAALVRERRVRHGARRGARGLGQQHEQEGRGHLEVLERGEVLGRGRRGERDEREQHCCLWDACCLWVLVTSRDGV